MIEKKKQYSEILEYNYSLRLFILVILLKIRFLHQIGLEVHFVLILAFARKHFHRNSQAPNHVCCHGYQRHLQGRLHLV